MSASGSIAELCIALRHRWTPEEWFLIFTAYFDESGTHGRAPTVVLAAFLGDARQWELFERRLRALQRRDGFAIFHGKELKPGSGDFRGWSDPKKQQLLGDLTALVRDTLTEGVTIALAHDRYMNEYRAPPVPKGMSLDSQYGVCFRSCLSHIVKILRATKKRHRLNVVIENNQRFGDCQRIFFQAKAHLEAQGINILGTITAATKKQSPPLMVADFLAHTIFLADKLVDGGAESYAQFTDETPRKRHAGLTMIGLMPDALTDLKRQFEEGRRRRVEQWRAERAARQASSASQEEPPS
ncbi:MAG TPA: DUF3800 domain-containing protein [Stellaceae bacterium]|nr:DUF3800 domain-containing protein [Stellaceae bacterium]